MTSAKGCRLDQLCDLAVHLPLERELCPFDLAPVTSTAIQMLFGDTAAIALMQACPLTAFCMPADMLCHPLAQQAEAWSLSLVEMDSSSAY